MITLGEFLKIIEEKNISKDSVLCLPYNPTDIDSINVKVNVVSITKKENDYGQEDVVTFATSTKHKPNNTTIRTLIDKHTWEVEDKYND